MNKEKINEIKEMTDHELHFRLVGFDHNDGLEEKEIERYSRLKLGEAQCCTDRNRIHSIEAKIIEKFGFTVYRFSLEKILGLSPIGGLTDFLMRQLWVTEPRQRAEACLLTIEINKNNRN